MSKGCLKCGTQNADNAKLCRGCGAALGDQPSPLAMARAGASPVCRVCSHVNRSATRFCSKCGTDQTLMTDPDPATEPADYSILASLPPRGSAAAARAPAHPAAGLFGAEPAPRPLGLWLGLGALVVALVAGAAWWARSSHGTSTTPAPAASVAQPSASVAAVVVAPASAPGSEPASAAVVAASAPAVDAPASAPVAAFAPEPVASAAASTAAPAPVPAADADKAAREAKAKSLRERRAQAASQAAVARTAEQESARRRADDARAAAASTPAPAPPPAVVPPAAPAPPRTAQETCAGSNLIVRTLCESRACSRREHADEPLCQRLRAAEEKRRQQD